MTTNFKPASITDMTEHRLLYRSYDWTKTNLLLNLQRIHTMFSATATTMMTASRRAAVAACVRTADSVCARTVDTVVAAASRAMSTSADRRMDTSRSLGIVV